MSFLSGAECSTAANPLSQFTKHVQDDKSLQRDRLVGTGPGGLQETFRSQRGGPIQDEVGTHTQHFSTKGFCSRSTSKRLTNPAGNATIPTAEWTATPRITATLLHGADAAGSRWLPDEVTADWLTTLVVRVRSTRAGKNGGGLPESEVRRVCTTWI